MLYCVQGKTVWKMEVPEELLSPRSRLAASAARRLAQGITKGMLNLGGILGNFGNFLAGEILQEMSLLTTRFMTCCPRLPTRCCRHDPCCGGLPLNMGHMYCMSVAVPCTSCI